MPWKSSTPVDLRMEFITRLHKGERITDLCSEYGISRKTGHKLQNRYEEFGATGLVDQSRAPKHVPHRTTPELVELVLAERKRHPTLLQKQEWFDAFMVEFNEERPHEALAMKCPAQVYGRSERALPATLPEPEYAMHDEVLTVDREGVVRLPGRGRVYVSMSLVGHPVGVREEDDGRWLVSFMDLDLGHVETNRQFTPMAFTPPKAARNV